MFSENKETSRVYSSCYVDNLNLGSCSFLEILTSSISNLWPNFLGLPILIKGIMNKVCYIKTGLGKSKFTVVNKQNKIYSCYYLLTIVLFTIWTPINLLLSCPVYAVTTLLVRLLQIGNMDFDYSCKFENQGLGKWTTVWPVLKF